MAGGPDLVARLRGVAEAHHPRPEAIECKGCGRRIPIGDLPLWQRFLCRRCLRPMRLTAPLFRFRYTRAYRLRKRLYTLLLGLLLVSASTAWGHRLVALIGHPVAVYALTAGVAAAVAVGVAIARERTEEYRLIGGFMLMALGARRLILWPLAEAWGHPRPWAILAPGIAAVAVGIGFVLWVRRRRRTLPVL